MFAHTHLNLTTLLGGKLRHFLHVEILGGKGSKEGTRVPNLGSGEARGLGNAPLFLPLVASQSATDTANATREASATAARFTEGLW